VSTIEPIKHDVVSTMYDTGEDGKIIKSNNNNNTLILLFILKKKWEQMKQMMAIKWNI
jgi:hypothetical protein